LIVVSVGFASDPINTEAPAFAMALWSVAFLGMRPFASLADGALAGAAAIAFTTRARVRA
jgi:hypothetical protein